MNKDWTNLAKIVYRRTYARRDTGVLENWKDTVDRVIAGNTRHVQVSDEEKDRLRYFMMNRKAIPAGRGLWFSGAPSHEKIGGCALNNCYYFNCADWNNFVIAQDMLMLGGGVGLSVENRFVSKLPKIKRDVTITHIDTNDADYIVPDSREGWCELSRRIYESFFVTGKSFTYSTVCVRGYGQKIKGFGGVASGPLPLIAFVQKLCNILKEREGKHLRPLDAADLICVTGEMVVAGNVRRSAIIILGDPYDKVYLAAKRWSIGNIPTYRAFANFSVVVDDTEDLHPAFWKTYEDGEPFGIVNRANIQKYGRMGEEKLDTAEGVNPCAEATLESGENCVRAGTRLITLDSIVKIEDHVGKTVDVWNGEEWSSVEIRQTSDSSNFYRVRFDDGSFLDVTPGHRFQVKNRFEDEWSQVTTVDLQELITSGKYPVFVPSSNVQYSGGIYEPLAYDYGVFFGDGSIQDENHVPFAYLFGPKMNLPITGKTTHTQRANDNQPSVRVTWPNMDVNLCVNLRQSRDLSPQIFGWNRQSILNFIAGWADADGAVQGRNIRIYGSKTSIETAQLLATKIGIISSVSLMVEAGGETNFGIRNHDIWYLTIHDGSQLPTHRLRPEQKEISRKWNNCVRSVESLNITEPSYCFEEPKRHMAVFNNVLTYQCNLQEIPLMNLDSEGEFIEASRLMHRYGKRVAMEKYHQPMIQSVVHRNMRIGTGITGCLASPLFNPGSLDRAYAAIQEENVKYSKELKVPESIRTTVVKPSGTVSKLLDQNGYEGIHPAFSRYIIQRVRFATDDPLIPILRAAKHPMEPVIRFDGTYDNNTMVVDFYVEAPDGFPVADEDWDTWKQLDVVKMAQAHWADQSVSVTVYYRKEDIAELKVWLSENLQYIKTISFLCHSDHGFKQAPKEKITKDQFMKMSSKVKQIDFDQIGEGEMESQECVSGACPIR